MRNLEDTTIKEGKTLRILHITGMRSKKFGSIERWYVELARQCRDKNYPLTVTYIGKPASEEYRDMLHHLGVTLVAQKPGLSFSEELHLYRQLIRKYEVNVLHTHFDPHSHIGNVAGVLSGVRQRYRTYHSMTRFQWMPRLRRLRSRITGRFSLRLVHEGMTVSRAVLEDYAMQLGLRKKITCLPLGIDCTLFGRNPAERCRVRKELGISEAAWVIGTVSRADPVKGLDVLVKAFIELHEEFPMTHLLIAGGDQGLDELNQMACGAGLSDHVAFAGTRDDIPAILAAMDMFVLPSRSEGMPTALLEALAAELPVVASNVGGIPEVVTHGVSGLLVPPDGPHLLAEAIGNIIGQPDEARMFARAGKQYVEEHFNVVNHVSRLVALYESGGERHVLHTSC